MILIMQKYILLSLPLAALISCAATSETSEDYVPLPRVQPVEPAPNSVTIEVIPPPRRSPVEGVAFPAMFLVPSGWENRQGNPIYNLNLYDSQGQLVREIPAVSGRSYSQGRDRHRSGTKAPLPNGKYRISPKTVPGSTHEVGGVFLPISPSFPTGRTDLGIHWDPSFEKGEEDGTDGCIGTIDRAGRDAVLEFLLRYQPQFLHVLI